MSKQAFLNPRHELGAMVSDHKAKNPVSATKTAFEIIQALQDLDGAGITELAAELDKSKGSVHNHLSTLYEMGYVTKEGSTYNVGIRFLEHGIYARKRRPLYENGRPEVDTLAEETGEMANLLVEEHGKGIYLHRATGENAVNVDAQIGTRVHLHNTALGKAILAYLPQARVESILDRHGMPSTTDRTIDDRETLFDRLELVRERGVAFDDEERLPGLQCLAVPVLNDDGKPEGALSVSAPTRRMADNPLESEVVGLLKDTANIIKLNITYA
jgi:DNA-binding IclR family transcriptional regulator